MSTAPAQPPRPYWEQRLQRVPFPDLLDRGLRHLRPERDRLTMLVSKPTHGGGAPLGIDLDAGIAKIRVVRPAPPAQAADETAADPAQAVAESVPAGAAPAGTDAAAATQD